jgi:hypothetical protein
VREVVDPPREVADEHTLIAQRYAGYFVGHPYRAEQQGTTITIDRTREWREPSAVRCDCELCVRLTDAEAIRRVAGYQWQLDIESTRTKGRHYAVWMESGDPRIPEPADHIWSHSQANLRMFVELFQSEPREGREHPYGRKAQPLGWRLRPLPMVDLPLRLKRKLCVEWNHALRSWMIRDMVFYDFEQREFWREVPDVLSAAIEPYAGPEW